MRASRLPAETPADAANVLRYGRVESVDRAAGTCRVRCGEILTPPLPWLERAQGTTRTWSPPAIGEQVIVHAPEGELEMAIVQRGAASNAFPAHGDMDRELIEFGDGGLFAYDEASHHLEITLPAGGTATIVGNVTITGTLTVSEDVTAGGKSLMHHRHTGVQAGGAQTGEPA